MLSNVILCAITYALLLGQTGGGGGLLQYVSCIGMWCPKGHGFLVDLVWNRVIHFTILVWNWVWFLRESQHHISLGNFLRMKNFINHQLHLIDWLIILLLFCFNGKCRYCPFSLSVAKTGVTCQVSVVSAEPCLVLSLCEEGSLLDMFPSSTGNLIIPQKNSSHDVLKSVTQQFCTCPIVLLTLKTRLLKYRQHFL